MRKPWLRLSTVISFLALFGLQAVIAAAQATITNADVTKMLKAGLSEALVISAIQSAPQSSFDVNPDALIALKGAGLSDAVIAAMMARAGKPAVPPGTTMSAAPAPVGVVVPENTEVPLRLIRPVTSKTARVEDRVDLEVARDVIVNGVLAFRKGAPGRGTVTEVAKSRSFGRSGNLAFSIEAVEAADGQSVRLNTSRSLKGDARTGATVAAVVLVGVFGGFVKGKDIEVPAGTEYITYTTGEKTLGVGSTALTASSQTLSTAPAMVQSGMAHDSIVGGWTTSLPSTGAVIGAGANGRFLFELQGQYAMQGELMQDGNYLTGTVSSACMSSAPITLTLEGNGWTGRTDYIDCTKPSATRLRIVFRLMR